MEIIKIIDIDNVAKEVEVIGRFTLEKKDKEYIIYTDNIEDNNSEIYVSVSEVKNENGNIIYSKVHDNDIIEVNDYINNVLDMEV